jgi:hypothetical protein
MKFAYASLIAYFTLATVGPVAFGPAAAIPGLVGLVGVMFTREYRNREFA